MSDHTYLNWKTGYEGSDELSERFPVYSSVREEAEEEPYWAWFCSIPGLYPPAHRNLLLCGGDPWQIYYGETEKEEIREKVLVKAEAYRKKISAEGFWSWMNEQGMHFVSIRNPGYPHRLRNISDPPVGFFYRGILPCEETGAVAVVGARMCSRYGKEMAEIIARTVARCGGQVISGAAWGIDGAAQMAALKAGGSSFAVLGCGVNRPYPSENRELFELLRENGGLGSEYGPDVHAQRFMFPMRNRLISALSDITVVVEAKKRSGSLITAGFAAEQGKDVYAVPGRAQDELSEGCNELICQGAGIYTDSERFEKEVLLPIGLKKRTEKNLNTLAPQEKLVYSILNFRARGVYELSALSGIAVPGLLEILMKLELKGLAEETSRNYYKKIE